MKNNIFKKIFTFTLLLISIAASAQDMQNWYNQDPGIDKFAGVSTDVSYAKLLEGKTSNTVIVAVIDGGSDVNHPDLQGNLWTNEKEIPGNNIDDDGNGYVDDIHGWNFIGGPTGDVEPDNVEIVRLYRAYLEEFKGIDASNVPKEKKKDYQQMLNYKSIIDKKIGDAEANLNIYERLKTHLDDIKLEMGGDDFTGEELAKNKDGDEEHNKVKLGIANAMQNGNTYQEIESDIMEGYKYFNSLVKYHYNINFDSRFIVNDNYSDYDEKHYGNANVIGPDALHGTHVAGIIGAVRNNDMGGNGVAADVRLMIIRTVPDGDERDKDVANAIRYAVDNGAKIINMSFGKDYSPGKIYVDAAVKYAVSKDVLLVHAAGNDASNNDYDNNFPSPYYLGSKERIPGWIEVGAISSSGDLAGFSNYGQKSVDVLAPGVQIYSTLPGGEYGYENGTSMAAPVVSGVAAIIRSYYPQLTADEVKNAIMASVIKPNIKTHLPGSKKKVKYKKLCTSAGIVNVYLALRMIQNNSNQ